MASYAPGRWVMVALSCVLLLASCGDLQEPDGVRVLLEVVGSEPTGGATFCGSPAMWWVAKRVNDQDVNVDLLPRGADFGNPGDDGPECIWSVGPSAFLIGPARYRILATDGEWLAVCPIQSLFLAPGGIAAHRIRFTHGEPGCEVSIVQ